MSRSFYARLNNRAAKICSAFFARLTDCGFVKVRTQDQTKTCRKLRLFGKTLCTFGAGKKPVYDTAKPPVYLKINRDAPYTLFCIQRWLNIFAGGVIGIT